MNTSRRDFLVTGAAAGAAAPFAGVSLAPAWLRASGNAIKKLVVIQIRGGWDYLQILPQSNHPIYQAARPNLKIAQANTLQIQNGVDFFWHPALQPFKDLFDSGRLAVINNIGYPNPNLSHFESEKKWYAGDPAATVLQSGWLARYLATGYTGGFPIPAIDIEGSLNDSFSGARVPVITNPAQLATQFAFQYDPTTAGDNFIESVALKSNALLLRDPTNPDLQYVASSIATAVDDAALLQAVGANYTPAVTYPANALANALMLAARYIIYNLPTEIYYTSTGGYDNHANEVVAAAPYTGTLANLLAAFSAAVKAFLDDLQAQGHGNEVVVMVFSEFSRRLGENGSLGTDHGHGGVAFLAGAVNAGLYGNYPNLNLATTPYNNYYIPFNALSTDFRSLYATVLERALGTNHVPILGQQFPLLGAL
jgi:uncharacterized protein (DUF1501 family)